MNEAGGYILASLPKMLRLEYQLYKVKKVIIATLTKKCEYVLNRGIRAPINQSVPSMQESKALVHIKPNGMRTYPILVEWEILSADLQHSVPKFRSEPSSRFAGRSVSSRKYIEKLWNLHN